MKRRTYMRATTFVLVATVAAGVVVGPSLQTASAETPYATREGPIEGQRYETLRALAHHLDETARGALEGATDDARHGASSAARFVSSIRSFARGADDFHRMVENYRTSPFDVPVQVDDLTVLARQMNDRIRSARTLESTYDDWDAILDVLARMRLLLAGRDVEVPAAHVVAALSGSRLQEFRQLVHDLEVSATGAHARAKRDVGDYRGRGQQFLGELNYFATRSRDLHTRTDADVDPQQIGPIVDDLLQEARQADRRMRDAQVFTQVWDDSGRTITILQRMASLVRS
jgi:hypothetical protein